MKNLSIFSMLCLTLFVIAGCSTTPEEQKEKEAFYEEGKMDDHVESWKQPGGRY